MGVLDMALWNTLASNNSLGHRLSYQSCQDRSVALRRRLNTVVGLCRWRRDYVVSRDVGIDRGNHLRTAKMAATTAQPRVA